MEDLPELAFKKLLSYLSLKDRIKAMTVSQGWRNRFDFKRKTLCYSNRPMGFIEAKNRLVSGVYAENFINSKRLVSFFKTFSPTILSNLNRLRLCEVRLEKEDLTTFIESLQSFGQLEEIHIIHCHFPSEDLKLSLTTLQNVYLEYVSGIDRLTLDAPRLQKVRIDWSLKKLELVCVESVKIVTIDHLNQIMVKNLKNLKKLYINYSPDIDPTLLSSLGQLREVHLNHGKNGSEIFEQKQRYGSDDLKIYLYGLILKSPEDPETKSNFDKFGSEMFIHWAENQSRLADEIPFHSGLRYSAIERVEPELAINILKRITDLTEIYVGSPVQDLERFFDILKNPDIVALFIGGDHPQRLFDGLPEHCAIQRLTIRRLPPDNQFLFRLKHLTYFCTCSIDVESIRRILNELEFISLLELSVDHKFFTIKIIKPKHFEVCVEGFDPIIFPDLNAATQYIAETRFY